MGINKQVPMLVKQMLFKNIPFLTTPNAFVCKNCISLIAKCQDHIIVYSYCSLIWGKMFCIPYSMEEHEIRAVLAENIKTYRGKRGWSQLHLSEQLDISANFLSEIENGKGWVSPLTLAKLTTALQIEVFELFMPISAGKTKHSKSETENMRRLATDLSAALDVSVTDAVKDIKKTIAQVCKEHLG